MKKLPGLFLRPAEWFPDRRRASRAPVADLKDGLDLLDPLFVQDPYPTYAALRAQAGLHRCKSGALLATRHRDVMEALASPFLGNRPSPLSVVHARNRDRFASASVASNILPYQDKPEHIVPRRLVGAAFRAHLAESKPDTLAIATALLRQHADGGTFDLLADFGRPFSARIMAALMGLPEDDLRQLTAWSQFFFRLFAPFPSVRVREQTDQALSEFRAYFAALIGARRKQPHHDFISRLTAQESDGRRLSDIEIADNCMLLFSDGIENLDAALANLVLALDAHPSAADRVRRTPSLRAGAVREGLRYDSPAQIIPRIAREDGAIGGRAVRCGSVIFLALGSANRDEGVFPEADAFDPARDHQAVLSFGKGSHSCLGRSLVIDQLEAALTALISASSAWEFDRGSVVWQPRFGHRWPTALPTRLIREG